jgi:hypothetical protein
MAATNQLERIAKLVERLGPITKKQRGMRIEADEWNALVDVLLGVLQVDRAQEESTQVALEQRFATKVHEHLGTIGITWLDSDLQTRMSGQQGAVPTRTALAEMEKRIQGIGAEVARLTTVAESLQKLLDASRVDEVDRSRTLRQFETRFAGVENLRTLVTTLNADVDGVRGNIETVLELRKTLTDPQGNPIDIAALRTELSEVQGLRENLKGVSGELLRLKDIELKLNEVADAAGVGGEGGLDQRLADLSGAVEGRLNARLDERNTALQQSLEEQHAASETRLRNELNTSLDARAKVLDESVTVKLGESESRIGLTVDAKIAASATSVRTQADASAKALIDARLAGLPAQVRATTAEMIVGLRADLVGELRATLTTDMQTRFTALESSLNTRLGAMEGRLVGFEGQIPTLVAGSVDAARESLETALNQELQGRMEATRAALEESLSGQVQSVVADVVGDLDGRIVASLNQRLSGLDETIAKSVTAATRNLPDEIGAEVKRQIASLDLAGQIGAANASLAQQLRAEQAAALAQQQAKLSEAINGSVTLLRGEISALRTEVNTTIDTRIKQSSLSLQESFSTQLKGLEGRLKPDAFRSTVVVGTLTPIR